MIIVHATHEAGMKVGGIGAVLDGLLTAPSYLEQVERTILVGPLATRDATAMERLFAPRNKLTIRYFADRGIADCDPDLAKSLCWIESEWNVRILYGLRAFGAAQHEVILVDASGMKLDRQRNFKYFVWERFGLDCYRYDSDPEFNEIIAAAEPSYAALRAILGPAQPGRREVLLSHEFMGLPLWYASELAESHRFLSTFIAHEVATARSIVEGHLGHDTRFYNVMRQAMAADAASGGAASAAPAPLAKSMEDVFGSQGGFFKHAMLKTVIWCDRILAVGDPVVEELRFLDADFRKRTIDLVYNGTSSRKVSLSEAREASRKLRAYALTLTGMHPDYVFSHVTRLVISKGLWRDIRVMEHMDGMLAERGESAVVFMLSSVIPQGRSNEEAQSMAQSYGWPASHREGWPDLVALELPLYQAISDFNSRARASKIVLINQFGFSRDRCGDAMPADMSFEDLRLGTDLEFGQSIYEPFGIAQIEPLSSGAICLVSDVCGCVGLIRRAGAALGLSPDQVANVVVANYTQLPAGWGDPIFLSLTARDEVERTVSAEAARTVFAALPRSDSQKQALLDRGQQLAQHMSWDVIAREQLLPALTRTN